jgi:hypothetical protein
MFTHILCLVFSQLLCSWVPWTFVLNSLIQIWSLIAFCGIHIIVTLRFSDLRSCKNKVSFTGTYSKMVPVQLEARIGSGFLKFLQIFPLHILSTNICCRLQKHKHWPCRKECLGIVWMLDCWFYQYRIHNEKNTWRGKWLGKNFIIRASQTLVLTVYN